MGLRSFYSWSLLVVGIMLGCECARLRREDYYRAAVYEHARINVANTITPEMAVRANLWYYERAAELAKQQGADLILYPEYGLFEASSNRSEIRQYLEVIPNPKEVSVNPCDEEATFSDRPIMLALSCMAKTNDIVVVANMGSLEYCDESEPECPEDGAWQFNANVAFDKNGTLVARYYKERLYFEMSLDLPRVEQDPIVETKFARFAMFICFDIIFEKMAVTSRLPDVDAILFSTMWFSSLPFFTSTQWFQAWAMGNDVTFLASNVQTPGYALAGSGIFRGTKGSVVHNFNPDNTPKLMVATLPRRNRDVPSNAQITAILRNGTGKVLPEGTNVTGVCSYDVLGTAQDIFSEFRCMNENVGNYTLIKLNKSAGRLRVCNNGMCCKLEYEASGMNESFYLGVYNGSYSGAYSFGRYYWWEENCFLARCDDLNGTACRNFLTTTDTLFRKISLTADVTTQYVYPSFVSSRLRLVPVNDWIFGSKHGSSTIKLTSSSGIPIIAATLKGRVYNRDPPYVR